MLSWLIVGISAAVVILALLCSLFEKALDKALARRGYVRIKR